MTMAAANLAASEIKNARAGLTPVRQEGKYFLFHPHGYSFILHDNPTLLAGEPVAIEVEYLGHNTPLDSTEPVAMFQVTLGGIIRRNLTRTQALDLVHLEEGVNLEPLFDEYFSKTP